MKRIEYVFYKCEVCLKEYFDEKDAIACETFPIAPNQFKMGDTVKVKDDTRIGKVTNIQIESDFKNKEHWISHVTIDDVLHIHINHIEKHNG